MSQSQPHLLDTDDRPAPGWVSPQCHFCDDENVRLVFIDGKLAYNYDRSDQLAARQVWVMVYESGHATYEQIAGGTGISRRAVQYWVKRYREEGAAGLPDRPRSGAPKKVTAEVRRKIYRLRDRRLTLREIARHCQISERSVRRALHVRDSAAQAKQQALPLTGQPEHADASGQAGEPQ